MQKRIKKLTLSRWVLKGKALINKALEGVSFKKYELKTAE